MSQQSRSYRASAPALRLIMLLLIVASAFGAGMALAALWEAHAACGAETGSHFTDWDTYACPA